MINGWKLIHQLDYFLGRLILLVTIPLLTTKPKKKKSKDKSNVSLVSFNNLIFKIENSTHDLQTIFFPSFFCCFIS